MTPPMPRSPLAEGAVDAALARRLLEIALSTGGDYADLYFESVTSTSLGIDESIVKTASQGISVGCGVRVLSAGEGRGRRQDEHHQRASPAG